MSLFTELKRRNVFRMALLYLGAAWLVVQVVDVLIDRGPLPESLGPVMLIVLAIGFPIALLLAWFYEVTPEGILPDEVAVAQEGATPVTGRTMDFVVIAVLAAAVLLFAWDKWWTGPPPARSIAVLPFVNMSTDEETAYLGTGIAETILNMLAQMPELQVTSATSSFQSRLEGLSAPEIAGLLGVATVLEGSVQRHGNRLRVTAQLIDAENDTHLWSSNFDRDDTDIFKVQDEIALAVTSALHVVMRDEVRQRIDLAGTDNPEAYDAYIKAEVFMKAGKRSKALPLVQRALELDPDYALAWVALADLSEHWEIWPELTPEERGEQGRAAAEKAIELAPDLPAALTILADYTRDWNIKRQLLRRAYENGPNDVEAIVSYARYLMWTGKAAESDALARKALALDPLFEFTYATLVQLEIFQQRHDRAFEIIALWQERFPESTLALNLESIAHWTNGGDTRSGFAARLKAIALQPEDFYSRWQISLAYLLADMPEAAQRWVDSMAGMGPIATIYVRNLPVYLNVYYQHNDEQVFAEAGQLLLEDITVGNYFDMWQFFVEYGERLGRLDEVLATFEELNPNLFGDPPHDLENTDRAALYATGLALLRNGDVARGEPLMRAYLAPAETGTGLYVTDLLEVNAYLALGERETALETFRKFVQVKWYSGFVHRVMLRYSSLYDPIRNEPEFIALLEAFDRNQAEQRRLLKEADFPIPDN